MKNSEKQDFKIGYFTLAYLDVLSQKDQLRKIDRMPENETEKMEFIEKIRNTCGVVLTLREAFENIFNSLIEGKIKQYKSLDLDYQKFMDHFQQSVIKKQLFSDTIIYYTPLAEDKTHIPIVDIYNLLSSVSGIFLLSLGSGLALRGGIEVGIACELSDNEIYGPALYHAHRIENEVSQYPRIVIGEELLNYIRNESNFPGESPEAKIRRLFSQKCVDMTCMDTDGLTILDYIGKQIKFIFQSDDEIKNQIIEMINRSQKFIINEWERFKLGGNYKLSGRYHLLNQYINDRKNRYWVDENINETVE